MIAVLGALGALLAQAAAAPDPEPPAETIWSVPVAHGAGLLLGMRLSLSILWPEPFDPLPLSRSARQFGLAYTRPPDFRQDRPLLESDGDPWTINVVAHGLFGSEMWSRVRQCGGGPLAAMAFTVGTSVAWEYGVESFSKRPSAVDLVLTPVLGAVIGEGRYRALGWLRGRPRGFWRRFGEILLDPLGEAERGLLRTRC